MSGLTMYESDDLPRKIDKQLSIHEAVCAERYERIEKAFVTSDTRSQRIEYILYLVTAISVFGSTHLGELIKQFIMK